ncbi:MAG: galactokinase [Candidatus Aminicenantes bacterium]
MSRIAEKVRKEFQKRFSGSPLLVRSPGRVNLIGEHTDYNQGFVLPAAVDKSIYLAVAGNNRSLCRFYSFDMDSSVEMPVKSIKKSDKSWANYLLGMVSQLQQAGYDIPGFDCAFSGDIPIGAGLSSSAAIETGLGYALNQVFELDIKNLNLVRLAQKAENEFVGVRCGIMDQFINIFGVKDKVLKIDCRTLEYEYYPFSFPDVRIILYDTGVSHSLASSEYNQRGSQCEEGVRYFQQFDSDIKSLRDVGLGMLKAHRNQMNPVIFRRCRYVVNENLRLESACRNLENKNLPAFGKKMYQTHYGLRDDYQVSCAELDFLVGFTENQPEILGARMMGGGFGGCTINLFKGPAPPEFENRIKTEYEKKFTRELKIYKTRIESGTYVLEERT